MVDHYHEIAVLEQLPPIDPQLIPTMLSAWRARWKPRDDRINKTESVVSGDYTVTDPDEQKVENRSPNLVQVGIEDTAEAASLVPTTRVTPHDTSDKVRQSADLMEKMAQNYLELSDHELLLTETLYDLVGRGFAAWVTLPDEDDMVVRIERTNASWVYPEPGWRRGQNVRRCLTARNVYASALPLAWREALLGEKHTKVIDHNTIVTFVEYFDDRRYCIYGIYENHQSGVGIGPYHTNRNSATANAKCELLDHWPHELGFCPVYIEQRITFDGEPRGQFDQTIGMQKAHVELWGMVMDYADQAVYSDIWVRDVIGEVAFGGGSYIELGPNGAIGRVPPAVSSLNVVDNLARLEEAIHLGGRWPASRPGEIDQSIASAKFLEASAGMMNTAIRTYHMLLGRLQAKALRGCFAADKQYFPGKKMMAGTLRNQQFVEEYDTDDIDLRNRVRVDYGIGFGREPSQSALLGIQFNQLEIIDDETLQESIEGLDDIAKIRARVDIQKFREIALAKLIQGLTDGTVPERAMLEIVKARRNQEELFDLYEKWVIEPAEKMQAQLMQGGLGGPVAPGLQGPLGALGPGGGPGGPAGGAPAVPTAPLPAELLGRITQPAGPGGSLGVQTQGTPV